MNRPRLTLSLALAATAVAAGCGGSGGDPDADPAALVPARAPLYIEASLKKDEDFDAIAKKLAGTNDAGAELKKLFERAANEGGGDFDWDKDVAPWIGERIAVFGSEVGEQDFQGALVAPTKDADKAKDTLEKALKEKSEDEKPPQVADRTYKDTKYKLDTANDEAVVILDEYAVNGTEQGVKAVIDAQDGEPLSKADGFKKARDEVDDDATAFGYVNVQTILSGLGPQGAAAREFLGSAGETFAFSLDAEDDSIDVETASLGIKQGAAGDPGALIAELPGDAWLAGGTADIGGQLERALQQVGQLGALGGTDLESALGQVEQQTGIDVREELAWMGDGGVFVRGQGVSDIGGALVVQSKDAAKTEAFVGKLARLVRQFPGVSVRSATGGGLDEGITVRAAQLPLPVHVGVAGDRFIVAVTDAALEAALKPSGKLADNAAYKQATERLGDDVKPSLFLDLAPVRQLIDASGQLPQDEESKKARQVLDHLTTIAAGTKVEGDVQRGRFSVGVK